MAKQQNQSRRADMISRLDLSDIEPGLLDVIGNHDWMTLCARGLNGLRALKPTKADILQLRVEFLKGNRSVLQLARMLRIFTFGWCAMCEKIPATCVVQGVFGSHYPACRNHRACVMGTCGHYTCRQLKVKHIRRADLW